MIKRGVVPRILSAFGFEFLWSLKVLKRRLRAIGIAFSGRLFVDLLANQIVTVNDRLNCFERVEDSPHSTL